jgi:hypothetical protein
METDITIGMELITKKPLIFLVSEYIHFWEDIGTIELEKSDKLLAKTDTLDKQTVKIYKYNERYFPMFGLQIGKKNPITGNIILVASAISLILEKVSELNNFDKVIFVIHDRELSTSNETIKYKTYENKQRLEKVICVDSLESLDEGDCHYKESPKQRVEWFLHKVLDDKKTTMKRFCEIELWSFQQENSKIYDALNPENNVYVKLIEDALTPNYKKKLVDIKFRTLKLILPLHIDFIGLSTCDKSKRTAYWDEIKKSIQNDHNKTRFEQASSLIDGNKTSDDIEPISSFAEPAGFGKNEKWENLKGLVGKDSNIKKFSDKIDDLVKEGKKSDDFIEVMKNFEFLHSENDNIKSITGYADWYTSVVFHFDELITMCQ